MLLRKTLILFLSVAGNWLTWNEIRGDEAKPKARSSKLVVGRFEIRKRYA
jgi:hypothetical protein